MSRNLRNRESVILSLHTHNDRGTGTAATELAMLAGADRVEGTLFGNGERTGNLDITTVALNLYTQGIDPGLDLSNIVAVREVAERCTELPVHPRHPYAGDLVFSAFSGSHQDAIRKGFRALETDPPDAWEVPYFIIDPDDVGRMYEPIIRINSQSGKGGVAYILHTEFGCDLPKEMQPEFSAIVQRITEAAGGEISAQTIWEAFSGEYLERSSPYRFTRFHSYTSDEDPNLTRCALTVEVNGEERTFRGEGNGPIDACRHALLDGGGPTFKILNYWEHARSSGSDADAAAYIRIATEEAKTFGVGIDPNTSIAAIRALLSALNRALSK
jgi:2-isopropylmalate synthase